MPPPRDLTGDRFGKLVARDLVFRPDRAGRWWRCDCDCGETATVAQNRLTVPDTDRRAVRACDACRARRCAICGSPYLKSGSAATCGASECRLTYRRMANNEIAARTAAARGIRPRSTRSRSRLARENPLLLLALREADREQQRLRRQAMTPDERADRNARQRERYAADPERYREYFRRWLAEMPPDRRAEWDAKARVWERQYRRRLAEAQMLREATALVKRLEDSDREN